MERKCSNSELFNIVIDLLIYFVLMELTNLFIRSIIESNDAMIESLPECQR